MPDTRQLELPTGQIVRICTECERETPEHWHYCPAVRGYSRSQVLREMVRVDDELRAIESQLVAPAPNRQLDVDHFLLRNEFWYWAWWLGLDYWAGTAEESRAARADIRAEVEETRQRTNRRRLEDAAA